MSYVIIPLGDAQEDALINELANFSVVGVHPIDKTRATNLVTKASAFIKKEAAIGVIPMVAIGAAVTYFLLKKARGRK